MTGIPRTKGGWWHDYVCPSHHVELDRHPTDAGYSCRYGCVLTGEPYASAWTTLKHQEVARSIRLLARRYAAHGDPSDASRAIAMLEQYAQLYAELTGDDWSEKAAPWMLPGKLFSQALTEAIWATQIADAVVALDGHIDSRRVAKLLESLLDTVAAAREILVGERDDLRNNYTSWLDCAGTLVSRALAGLDRPADVDTWRQRMFGHIRVAVGADGWEWEGSTYYHVFVLRAYLLHMGGCTPPDLPSDVTDRLVGMLRVLTSIATPSGALPVLNDGPYGRAGALREVVEVCALGRQFCPLPGLERIEAHARGELGSEDDGLDGYLTGWFSGAPLPVPEGYGDVDVFRDAGVVVLRSPALHAVLDAGAAPEKHGSHRHASQLSLYLYGTDETWQPAPGVPPYASRLRREYYARTIAHPTVRVDDLEPVPGAAVVRHEPGRVSVTSPHAYAGVTCRRDLIMTRRYLLDVVTVRCDDEHAISLGLRPGDELDIRATGPGTWRTTWSSTLHGLHLSDKEAVMEIQPSYSVSDDPVRGRIVADWKYRGREITFVSVYVPGSEPEVISLERESRTVHVTIGDRTDTYQPED